MLRLKEPHPTTPKELLEAYDRIPSPRCHATPLEGMDGEKRRREMEIGGRKERVKVESWAKSLVECKQQ